MAKRKGKGKKQSPRSRAAAAKPRNKRGHFMPSKKAAPSAPASTTTAPATTPATAPTSGESPTTSIKENIDFIQSIIDQRKEMGIPTSELEKVVLGLDKKLGVRKQLQDFVDANVSKFSAEDPSGAAAQVLFTEVATLSENSLKASRTEAVQIYKKLSFIRDLAKRTQGEQSELSKKLQEVIAPVEEQLKKQTSFREFVKEKALDFKKQLPEKLVSKIPIVGGLLGEFMREKRESSEALEKYSGGLQERISRGGKSVSSLSFPGSLKEFTDRGSSSIGEMLGGTKASSIPGLLGGGGSIADTLGGIYTEVKKIRELLVDRFDPATDELKNREAELEAKKAERSASGDKADGKGKRGGVRGFLSDLMDGGFRKTKIGRAFRKARIVGKKALRGLRKFGKGGIGRAISRSKLFRRGRVLGKMFSRTGSRLGGKALGAVGKAARSLGGKAMSMGGGLAKAATNVGGKAMGAIGGAAKAGGGLLSSLWSGAKGLVGKVGDSLGSLKGALGGISGIGKVVIGAVGPLIETFFAAKDINEIKNNPELSPEEKKKQIGLRIGKAIGSVIAQVGLSAALGPAGSMIGALLETLGIGGGALGEWLTEQLGPEKLYDLATAIPVIGPMIQIPEGEQEKAKEPIGAGAAGEGDGGISNPSATGTISAPATPNTSLGSMIGAHNAEMGSLNAAQDAASSAQGAGQTNNAVVNSKVNNTVNNFNDDLRIRNNEPTIQQAQRMIVGHF